VTDPIDEIRAEVEDSDYDRRLLFLLFLVLLVILGAGVGTIAFPGTDGNESTPAPGVVTITPTTATPTPTPGGGTPATPVDTATPTATPTESDDDDDDGDDDDDTETSSPTPTDSSGGAPPRVALTASGSTLLAQVSDVAPGNDGQNAIRFENSGDAAGKLLVNDTTVVDHENALLDPEEAGGDDATTGELSGALRVRLSVTYADGTTEYLFGTSSGFVTLDSLDGANRTSAETLAAGEQATVTFEWWLPASAGNEIQSDGVEFDVDFVLRQTS
jgi:hypothetical protein